MKRVEVFNQFKSFLGGLCNKSLSCKTLKAFESYSGGTEHLKLEAVGIFNGSFSVESLNLL